MKDTFPSTVHRFQKGTSGNPGGRPGVRVRAEQLLEKKASDAQINRILKVILKKAEQGEPWACKMLMDRVLPPITQMEVSAPDPAPFEELEAALDRIQAHSEAEDERLAIEAITTAYLEQAEPVGHD
jgi:hypothetical protein